MPLNTIYPNRQPGLSKIIYCKTDEGPFPYYMAAINNGRPPIPLRMVVREGIKGG